MKATITALYVARSSFLPSGSRLRTASGFTPTMPTNNMPTQRMKNSAMSHWLPLKWKRHGAGGMSLLAISAGGLMSVPLKSW